MTARRDPAADEARARTGFLLITAVRFGGVAMIMLGFAIVRGIVGLPYAAGVIVTVLGFLEVFFVPRFVARAWKRRDEAGR